MLLVNLYHSIPFSLLIVLLENIQHTVVCIYVNISYFSTSAFMCLTDAHQHDGVLQEAEP